MALLMFRTFGVIIVSFIVLIMYVLHRKKNGKFIKRKAVNEEEKIKYQKWEKIINVMAVVGLLILGIFITVPCCLDIPYLLSNNLVEVTGEVTQGAMSGENSNSERRIHIRDEKHIIYVNFRDDNENGARAKNAELRRAKISDATFDILMFYIEDYKELIIGQEYLFINVSGDYVGKPFKGSGVYAMLRRLERKTGIKASPHMLRHYFANARRKDGWKLEMISQALGHRNIETTMKYLNITEDELIEVSDAFYNRHQAMYGVQNLL